MEITKLDELLAGEPGYRHTQAEQAIFHDLAEDWSKATGLPKELRQKLDKQCPLGITAMLFTSDDKLTGKALITLADGNAVETVLMKHKGGRNTVCVSCMVGCPMRCTFCATGAMGLERKLTIDEILSQIIFFARLLKKEKQRVDGIVFMGMGEPLLNYENVMAVIRRLNDPDGLNIGARHISISTCGILDGINKLAEEDLPVNLAISLHAPNDAVRSQLMPIARTYPLKELLKTVDGYIAKTKRKVMFEYIMIDGINDRDEHARELAKLMKNRLALVNLIRYNPTGVFQPSSIKQMKRFRDILENNGVTVTMRYRFGLDINGACGQLATERRTKK